MSLNRYARRRDDNEPEVIEALERLGATVQPLSAPRVPDLLVGFMGRTYLIEVKCGRGKLNEGQEEWRRGWRGSAVNEVRTVAEAIAVLHPRKEK